LIDYSENNEAIEKKRLVYCLVYEVGAFHEIKKDPV